MPNTGRKRYLEIDQNPNSLSYGDTRWGAWVSDPSACPAATQYLSAEVSGTVYRNNCPSGQAPQAVQFVVAYGAFYSFISQADANQQAQQFFDSEKQDYANQNGLCGVRSVSVTSITKKIKGVQFQLTRTITSGAVDVTVEAQAETNDGTSSIVSTNTVTVTIPDGQSQVMGTVDFSPSVVQTVIYCQISSTDPSTYTF